MELNDTQILVYLAAAILRAGHLLPDVVSTDPTPHECDEYVVERAASLLGIVRKLDV